MGPGETRVVEKMEVAVVGGSLAGLCAGTMLRKVGFDVQVFERSRGPLKSRGAGIVVQPELLRLLSEVGAPPLSTTGCSIRRTLGPNEGDLQETPMPQRFTSWEAIYAALRGAFPDRYYHLAAPVDLVHSTEDGVRFEVEGRSFDCRVLVGADGIRSPLRRRLMPQTTPRYAGYVAWRGVVDESGVAPPLVRFFEDSFSFCFLPGGGHALCYFIPGSSANAQPGTRRLNWVWYVAVPEGRALSELLTDNAGQPHDLSVPPGKIREAARRELRREAERLDPRFCELVRRTPEPFIQAIVDIAPTDMAIQRICLVGDAAFVVRPHTAAATAKAADDAGSLARALRDHWPDVDDGLSRWQQQQLPIGRELVNYGVRLGEKIRASRTWTCSKESRS